MERDLPLKRIHTLEPPTPRYGHACTLIKDTMYVFGGDEDDSELNDLYSLDLVNYEWTYHHPVNFKDKQNCPPGLSSSRCFFYKSKFYVHGGYTGENFNSELYEFSFDKMTWKIITCDNKPAARSYHSGIVYKNYFIIFGGFVEDSIGVSKYKNDIHYLNLDTMSWELCKVESNAPTPRSGHTANLKKNEMIIYGGFGEESCSDDMYIFNLSTKKWNQVDYFGYTIPKRYCHTSTLHADDLWIFGGSNGNYDMSDLICVNMNSYQSKLVKFELFPVSYHSTVLHKNSLIIFGGDDKDGGNETKKNETWKYELSYYPPPNFFDFHEFYQDAIFLFKW